MSQVQEILAVCNLIGKSSNFRFIYPEDGKKEGTKEEVLSQIQHASKVPIRKVALQKKWWKKSSTPLLIFHEKSQKAVALIPTSSGRYHIVNPLDGSKKNHRKEEALNFEKEAFCFYPSFQKSTFEFFIKEKKYEFILLILLSLLGTVLAFSPLFAVQWVFNHIYNAGSTLTGWMLAWGLGIASLGATAFLYLRNRRSLRLSAFFANRVEPFFWHRLFNIQAQFFNKISKHVLFHQVMGFAPLREGGGYLAVQTLFSTFFSLLYFVAMAIFSLPLTLIVLTPIILVCWRSFSLIHRKSDLKKRVQKSEREIEGFLSQSLSAIPNIRALGIEKIIFEKWRKQALENFHLKKNTEKARIELKCIHYVMPLGFLWIILMTVTLGFVTLPIGNLFAFYLALMGLCIAIEHLTRLSAEMRVEAPIRKESEAFFREPLETGSKDPGILTGEVSFEKISFKYHSSNEKIFENFSLKIAPQEKIALIAPSKGGKTTLMRLLLGLEQPRSGKVLLDKQDLSDLDLQRVRKQIGIIFYDEGIFAGSIYENIDVGRECSYEQIEKAIDLADFREDFNALPMGLNTLLSKGGETLSSGQKQRLLLTRALAKSPSILILDEGIDLLDEASQKRIFGHLKTLSVTQIILSQGSQLISDYVDREKIISFK